jgi:Mrp family chromosome partitioning ATPase
MSTVTTSTTSSTTSSFTDLRLTDTRSRPLEPGLGTNLEESGLGTNLEESVLGTNLEKPSIKIAVVGKGGSGKTTTSGILARALARKGVSVVALDCDTNPNLGISLGIGDDETERLAAIRQVLDDEGTGHAPRWDELIDRFGSDAPDGVRLAVVSRIENPEPG